MHQEVGPPPMPILIWIFGSFAEDPDVVGGNGGDGLEPEARCCVTSGTEV